MPGGTRISDHRSATVLTGLDKGWTKDLLVRAGIPTPRYFVAHSDSEARDGASSIGYPLIVKPLREGGHLGIDADSIVHDGRSLERAVRRTTGRFRQPALVEEYIDGDDMREFSVGLIGAGSRIHLPLEIDWAGMKVAVPILSFEAARRGLERVKPVLDPALAASLGDLADRTFDAVGAADLARVDIRARGSTLSVLEINIMPGLGPQSFLSLAAREFLGFDHGDLVRLLARESVRRHGLSSAA